MTSIPASPTLSPMAQSFAADVMRPSSSLSSLVPSPKGKKFRPAGTKGLYEVTTGATLLYAEPDASGTALCAIKGGVRFHGIPYKFGAGITAPSWLMIHTEDVPPPLLCFGKEAGIPEKRAAQAKQGISGMMLTLGNGAVPRNRTPGSMKDVQFVDMDNQFQCSGCIVSVKFFVGLPNIQHDLRFQIYRRVRDNIFRLVQETDPIPCPETGVQNYVLPVPLHVSRNDYVGWSHLNSGMITFEEGGNNMRWNNGRQGKNVNIDFKRSGSFTFSYEVTYQNHCAGHMLYKESAPAPVFSNPMIQQAQALWVRLDEKCIQRIRDIDRSTNDDDNLEVTVRLKGSQSESALSLPPIGSEYSMMSSPSQMSIGQRMSQLDSSAAEWSRKGKGCWISFRRFGPSRSPPNDNCGRWRQLNSMK